MDKPHFFATLESSDWAQEQGTLPLWLGSGNDMKIKKRSKILFYPHSFLYENMFDSEFSSPQKEMTIEMTCPNDCLNWLKDRKLPVLQDSQQHLIFLPKSFFFSANFFLLNS